jgi:hypothetical protein
MKEDMIFIPPELSVQSSCTLSRNITAIRLESRAPGKAKLGPILRLPAGSNLDVCGDGFNPRTVKVHDGNSYYFVFREDLEE